MASKRVSSKKAPWDRPSPVAKKKRPAKHLSAAQKKHAAARAKKAGRPYPNLVDNMHEASASGAARKKATKRKAATPKKRAAGTRARKTTAKKAARKTTTTTKKKAARKSSGRKTTSRTAGRRTATKKRARKASTRKSGGVGAATKDPKGGLTAAGRRAFASRDGSHLKPGVKKRVSEMSKAEKKRKGSWAARFYGRSELPALADEHGKPTRFALTAAAWGEPVPRTEGAARRIAAKGRALLARAAKS